MSRIERFFRGLKAEFQPRFHSSLLPCKRMELKFGRDLKHELLTTLNAIEFGTQLRLLAPEPAGPMLAMRLSLLCLLKFGSGEWTQVATSTNMWQGDGGRYGAVCIYVPSLNQLFLTGDSGYWHATFTIGQASWQANDNNLGQNGMDNYAGRERLAGAAPDHLPEVWLHGGRSRPDIWSSWEYKTDLWRYNLLEDGWDEITQSGDGPPSTFSWGHGMVWTKSNQEMWLYGGSGDVWSFPLPSNGGFSITWTKRSWQGPPHVYRKYFVLFWHNTRNELYVHGGIDTAGDPIGELWKYRMSDSTWEVVNNHTAGPSSVPVPRGYHVGGWREDDEELYIHGGQDLNNDVLHDLWRYTLSTDTWLLLSDTGPARQYAVGAWIPANLELWIVSGWDWINAVDADDTWKYTVSECGTFACPSNYVLKDNAVDIKAFTADDCCNLNTTTSTTGTSTSTATTHTVTSSTATSITSTSSTMSTLSTTTSTTSALVETDGSEAMRMTTALGGLITITLLS